MSRNDLWCIPFAIVALALSVTVPALLWAGNGSVTGSTVGMGYGLSPMTRLNRSQTFEALRLKRCPADVSAYEAKMFEMAQLRCATGALEEAQTIYHALGLSLRGSRGGLDASLGEAQVLFALGRLHDSCDLANTVRILNREHRSSAVATDLDCLHDVIGTALR